MYLTFDPPSYRSCMMALRICVQRFGRIPGALVVDGGREFHSTYFDALLLRYHTANVLLYGPSGVGKTTLIRQLEHRAGVVREPAFPGFAGGPRYPHPFAPVPLLLLETRPPDGATFNRAEYYQVALKQLGEYPYDPSWEQPERRRFGENSSSIPLTRRCALHVRTKALCGSGKGQPGPSGSEERQCALRPPFVHPRACAHCQADAMGSMSIRD